MVTVPQFKISSGTCNKNQATGGAFLAAMLADGLAGGWWPGDLQTMVVTGSDSSAKISSCFCRYLWYDLWMQQPLTFENRMARVLRCDSSTKESQTRLHFDIQSFSQPINFYILYNICIYVYKYMIPQYNIL